MMVQTHDLWKTYGRLDALRGMSLSVPEGSAFALIGANGAGKSTTIKVLMNILRPSRGSATVLGADSRRLSARELAQIGYVSENQDMPGRLTVAQYLNYLREFYPTWDRELERSVLSQLRLPPDRQIRNLSHGMRMKMSLACALPFRPTLLVLDEPFSGLDPLVRDEFMEKLLEQAGSMTVLISTHELADIENVASHVGFIDQGKLLFQESMSELSGRFREVRVTLNETAVTPANCASSWLQVSVMGNVLRFVESQFNASDLNAKIASLLPVANHIDVQPINLRSIFTVLARDAQHRAG